MRTIRLLVGLLCCANAFGGEASVAGSLAPPVIADVQALASWYEAERVCFPPLPGRDTYTLDARDKKLFCNLGAFPSAFIYDLPAHKEYGIPAYDVIVAQDRTTRDILFLDALGRTVYAVRPSQTLAESLVRCAPSLTSMLNTSEPLTRESVQAVSALIELHDRARIRLAVTLVDADDAAGFLECSAQAAALAPTRAALNEPAQTTALRGMMLTSDDLHISAISRSSTGMCLSIFAPTDFTNRVDVFSSDDLMQSNWLISAEYVTCSPGGTILWTDTGYTADDMLFYRLGNADYDGDGDGLSDAREIFIYGTDRFNADSDGDFFSDGEEVAAGSDPLNRYSVPPRSMLRASGVQLVDDAGNPVLLKSLSIGGWQAYEHWMLGCKPTDWVVTNYVGQAYRADKVPESTLRELLQKRFDHSVARLASQTNGSSGVGKTSISGPFEAIGGFGNNDWIRYDNVNFGAGVSRVSVAAAVDNYWGGQWLDMYVDSMIPANRIGSVKIGSSGAWHCAAQYEGLITNVPTGVRTVYVRGRSTHGDVCNFVGLRFYSHANTDSLLTTFRNSYFSTNDLDQIQALGYNCIRLLFLHTLLEDDANPTNYLPSGWAQLDWVLTECARRGLYCMLDLHGVPGGQSFLDHNGVPGGLNNRFWDSEWFQRRTEALWVAIAQRYATNPAVVGYELFSEPDPWIASNGTHVAAYTNQILPALSRLYTAIRSNDTQHVIFLTSNFMYTNMWDDIEAACPVPADKGWTNVCYTFHHYDATGVWSTNEVDGWKFEIQKGVVDSITRFYTRFMKSRNCPVYIGEFNPGDPQNYDIFLRQFNANGISWGHWNYRNWGWTDTSRPERRWNGWGIEHRTNPTNMQPDLMDDSYADLQAKFATYSHEYYSPHTALQTVIKNNNTRALKKNVYAEFYLNTFSAPNGYNVNQGWPWQKVETFGNTNAFRINNKKAQLKLSEYPLLLMRFKARYEADARFQIGDETGCDFSLDLCGFNISTNTTGPEAEVRLCIVRDEITSPIKNYDAPGVIVRAQYNNENNTISFYVYEKADGSNTYGTQKSQKLNQAFVAGAKMQMHVSQASYELKYNNSTICSGAHTMNPSSWINGAVAVVEAEQFSGAYVDYLDLDNFRAERPNRQPTVRYASTFEQLPNEMMLRAAPDTIAIRRYWSNARDTETYVTNGIAVLIPEEVHKGFTWLNPNVDFQNSVHVSAPLNDGVIEFSVHVADLGDGILKIAWLPENVPYELYSSYEGIGLYAEIKYENDHQTLGFDAVRQWGAGDQNRDWLGWAHYITYVPDQAVSFQISTNQCRIYYGANLLVNTPHNLNLTASFPNGLFPHVEFSNTDNTDSEAVQIQQIKIEPLDAFRSPEVE